MAINFAMIAMVSRIFPLICSGYHILVFSPLSTSSSPTWNIPGALFSSSHLDTPYFGLCFPGIVPIHTPHLLSLD
jgi:hypothetical protein